MMNKISIDIWGSCVSRDIFGLCLPDTTSDVPWSFVNPSINNYVINQYYAQCSFVSAFKDHYGPIFEVSDISRDIPNFVKKCIISEYNGETANHFLNSNSDWLIVDFRYIIYGIVAIDYEDGLTDYICNRDIDVIRQLLDSKGINYSIRQIRYGEFDYSEYFKHFIEFVKKRYKNKIILIEARETESFFSRNGDLSNSGDFSIQICDEYELSLQFKKETDCFLIRTPIDVFADHLHRWGKDATVHYITEYYSYAFDCIDAIIHKKPNIHKYLEMKFFEVSALMSEIRAGSYLSRNNS